MTEWQKTNETTVDFAYDGERMRVSKTPSGGSTTYYLLDGREIAEEMTGNNVTSYVGPGLICRITTSGREIYHPDGIGSTRAMTDANGQTMLRHRRFALIPKHSKAPEYYVGPQLVPLGGARHGVHASPYGGHRQ